MRRQSKTVEDVRKRMLGTIARRQGQGAFREAVLRPYGGPLRQKPKWRAKKSAAVIVSRYPEGKASHRNDRQGHQGLPRCLRRGSRRAGRFSREAPEMENVVSAARVHAAHLRDALKELDDYRAGKS